jgi:hypothetical protein
MQRHRIAQRQARERFAEAPGDIAAAQAGKLVI